METYQSSLNIASKPDFDGWEYGDEPTTTQLYYLMCRDPLIHYRINHMTEDALANWIARPIDESTDPSEPYRSAITQAIKWGQNFGFSFIVHLDQNDDLREPLQEGPGNQIRALHPYIDGKGGVTKWRVDQRGNPTSIFVWAGNLVNEIEVDISRVDIYAFNEIDNDWRGHPVYESAIDEIISLRMWRSVAATRARQYAQIGYLISRKNGDWSPEEVEHIEDAFYYTPVAAISDATVSQVGGVMTPNELEIVREDLKESMAAGFHVTKNDIKGAEAGEKLGTDANLGKYSQALRSLQRDAEPHVVKTLSRLGIEFIGWNPVWEVETSKQVGMLDQLVRAYTTVQDDPEIRDIVRGVIFNNFKNQR